VQILDGQPTAAVTCGNCSFGFEPAPKVLLAGQTARRRVRVDALYRRDRQSSNQYISHNIDLLLPIRSRAAFRTHDYPGSIHGRLQRSPWAAPAAVVI
jgi:hypothetical protein